MTTPPAGPVGVASATGGHLPAEQYHYPIHNNNNSFVSESPYSLGSSVNPSNGSDVLQKVVRFLEFQTQPYKVCSSVK